MGSLDFGRSSKLFCRWISSYKTFFSACNSSISRCPICTAWALDSSCFFSHSVSSIFSAFSCCPAFALHCRAITLRANSVAEMLCYLASSWICSLTLLVNSNGEVLFLHCSRLAFAMQSNGECLYNGFVELMPGTCPAFVRHFSLYGGFLNEDTRKVVVMLYGHNLLPDDFLYRFRRTNCSRIFNT